MSQDLLQRLASVGTTSLCDADVALRVIVGLSPIQQAPRLVGVARTVDCLGDILPILRALEHARSGDVLVVATSGCQAAVAGELFATQAAQKGLKGLVVDGYVRDVETLRSLSLPVYARGVRPRAGTAGSLGQIQVPVTCGGVQVHPGDLVVGDADGLVAGPAAHFEKAIDRAEQIERTESQILHALATGHTLFDLSNYHAHIATLHQQPPHPLLLNPPG